MKCTCGGLVCQDATGKPRRLRYRCHGCRRWVPWCFGAGDDMPYHCDNCWHRRNTSQETTP